MPRIFYEGTIRNCLSVWLVDTMNKVRLKNVLRAGDQLVLDKGLNPKNSKLEDVKRFQGRKKRNCFRET